MQDNFTPTHSQKDQTALRDVSSATFIIHVIAE